jgi:hypothetical protein
MTERPLQWVRRTGLRDDFPLTPELGLRRPSHKSQTIETTYSTRFPLTITSLVTVTIDLTLLPLSKMPGFTEPSQSPASILTSAPFIDNVLTRSPDSDRESS